MILQPFRNCRLLRAQWGIFALSLTAAEAFSKLNIFFWFGMGFGIPLLLLSFFSGAV